MKLYFQYFSMVTICPPLPLPPTHFHKIVCNNGNKNQRKEGWLEQLEVIEMLTVSSTGVANDIASAEFTVDYHLCWLAHLTESAIDHTSPAGKASGNSTVATLDITKLTDTSPENATVPTSKQFRHRHSWPYTNVVARDIKNYSTMILHIPKFCSKSLAGMDSLSLSRSWFEFCFPNKQVKRCKRCDRPCTRRWRCAILL